MYLLYERDRSVSLIWMLNLQFVECHLYSLPESVNVSSVKSSYLSALVFWVYYIVSL